MCTIFRFRFFASKTFDYLVDCSRFSLELCLIENLNLNNFKFQKTSRTCSNNLKKRTLNMHADEIFLLDTICFSSIHFKIKTGSFQIVKFSTLFVLSNVLVKVERLITAVPESRRGYLKKGCTIFTLSAQH